MSQSKTEHTLLPAYLILGEDELKRNRSINRLHKRFEAMGDLALNSDKFVGDTATGEEIVTACNTMPFTGPTRLVEVVDVEKLPKASTDQLITYLAAPCDTTVLCLVAQKMPKGTRLYKAVEKIGAQAIIDCTPPKRKDLTTQVRHMAVTHGVTITPSAAATLIDLIGINTVALDSELQKLAIAHRGDDPVNESEILSMVSRTAEAKPWEFVDAFAARNIKRCVSVYGKLETSPYALLGMCVTRIRELLSAKALQRRGELNNLATLLRMPEWRVRNHKNWVRNYSSAELIKALETARDTEQAMKSGSDPKTTFMEWILTTMRK